MCKVLKIIDGICCLELDSFDEFYHFYYTSMDKLRGFIWRGQKNAHWKLIPTLDRMLAERGLDVEKDTKKHFENFIYAARGRREKYSAQLDHQDEWWALGQHNGLATPLLDWTTSPFVAAFFAFHKAANDISLKRGIYGLHQMSYQTKCEALKQMNRDTECIKFIKPFSNENARLVNQSGLFTRAPAGTDLEVWTKQKFEGVNDQIKLLKVVIPNSERENTLRILNRMNINHLTLFPDLFGASRYCNMIIGIDNYSS